jgi:alginate O-acetyltransferase complex protein AlgJ
VETVRHGGDELPFAADASPVVVLADSHGLVFHAGEDMLARNAGLSDHLALALGFPVDLHATRGSGATPTRIAFYRKVRRDPAYLPSKKVLVWLFSAREFTESAWAPRIPVQPRKP